MAELITRIVLRNDSTANWNAASDVVLLRGEVGIEFTDDGKAKIKIGDGATSWASLNYFSGADSEISADDAESLNAAIEAAKQEAISIVRGESVSEEFNTLAKVESKFVATEEKIAVLEEQLAGIEAGAQVNIIDDVSEEFIISEDGKILSIASINPEKVAGLEDIINEKVSTGINDFAATVTDNGTVDTFKELIEYVATHGGDVEAIIGDISDLKELVGSESVADQITTALDASGFITGEDALTTLQTIKYEITSKPDGTLVNYKDSEIRVMCPANTAWKLQSSGENADENTYYIGFKAYAPAGAVSFKEDLAEIISDDTMYYFEENEFAGTDDFGRKYSIVWLPVARYDGSTWTYYGASSSESKYIGWYYSVEWYGESGVKIETDCVRINLSNEDCHNNAEPYFMSGTIKNLSVGDEVLASVNGSVSIPVGAGLKGSDEIRIADDGSLHIGSISFSKIVQEADEEIILTGGGAAG